MLYFRPILKLTLWTLPAFALLIGLGVWQIERLHWKLGLIAEMNAHLSAAPIPLEKALALPAAAAQYQHVALDGHFDNAKEAYAFATADAGRPVYHVLTPFRVGHGIIMVDRGFVPPDRLNPATRAAGLVDGERQIVGVWRTPDAPGWFTPKPDLAKHIWYSRDVTAIAKAEGLTLLAPVVVEADATPNPGGWPRGGQTVIDLPNNHLQYAITWFLLAAALLTIYFVFHYREGRLRFGKSRSSPMG